jgi:hypothetical protein
VSGPTRHHEYTPELRFNSKGLGTLNPLRDTVIRVRLGLIGSMSQTVVPSKPCLRTLHGKLNQFTVGAQSIVQKDRGLEKYVPTKKGTDSFGLSELSFHWIAE